MKLGLGDPYDSMLLSRGSSRKVRAYIDITKPASTIGVASAFLAASLFYFLYVNEPIEWFTVFFASATVAFAHGSAQALNMAEDAHIDEQTEHKKNRPIPSGIVTKEEARAIAWILAFAALWRGFWISREFGFLVSLGLFLGIFYNLDPIRAKERLIGVPWQAVSRGLLMFPGVWAAYGDWFSPEPWALSVGMMFYVLGFQNSADIIDRHIDAEFGIRTFVVEYGIRGTAVIASGSMFLLISWMVLAVEFGLIPRRLLSILLIIPFCLVMLYYMTFHPTKVSRRTGNHPSWLFFYFGMVLMVLIPLTVEFLQ